MVCRRLAPLLKSNSGCSGKERPPVRVMLKAAGAFPSQLLLRSKTGGKSERARATVVQVCLGLSTPGAPCDGPLGRTRSMSVLTEVVGELGSRKWLN